MPQHTKKDKDTNFGVLSFLMKCGDQNMVLKIYNSFLDECLESTRNVWHNYEIMQTDTETKIEIDMPGFEKSEILVKVQDDMLWVDARNKNRNCLRTFLIGSDVKPEEVTAMYRNGVLVLTLPKSDKAKAIKVDVQ